MVTVAPKSQYRLAFLTELAVCCQSILNPMAVKTPAASRIINTWETIFLLIFK